MLKWHSESPLLWSLCSHFYTIIDSNIGDFCTWSNDKTRQMCHIRLSQHRNHRIQKSEVKILSTFSTFPPLMSLGRNFLPIVLKSVWNDYRRQDNINLKYALKKSPCNIGIKIAFFPSWQLFIQQKSTPLCDKKFDNSRVYKRNPFAF